MKTSGDLFYWFTKALSDFLLMMIPIVIGFMVAMDIGFILQYGMPYKASYPFLGGLSYGFWLIFFVIIYFLVHFMKEIFLVEEVEHYRKKKK